LIALLYSASNTNDSWTTPSGWTLEASQYDGSGNDWGQHALFWKVATGSEPGSYGFAGGLYQFGQILQYSGANNTSPFQTTPAWQNYNSATSSFVAPSITATVSGILICQYTRWSGSGISTSPSGMTSRQSQAASSHASQYVYDESISTGATSTKTATLSSTDTGTAFSFALAQASTASKGQFFPFL
jgi:hypothetical protein